jgi:hypothetical protein
MTGKDFIAFTLQHCFTTKITTGTYYRYEAYKIYKYIFTFNLKAWWIQHFCLFCDNQSERSLLDTFFHIFIILCLNSDLYVALSA